MGYYGEKLFCFVEFAALDSYSDCMTVTLDEAQANLARIISQAVAGEDVVITANNSGASVKLVPVQKGLSRLARHPDLIGSTKTLDSNALTKPLPAEEWGGLAER